MITASIVTYNTKKNDLTKVLECLKNSSIERIYIVDNSPTDDLKTFAELSSKIYYIYGQGNIGYGSAHNIAIEKSIKFGAKYHVVINPDIYFENGTIEALAKYMDENEDNGQIMPKVVYPNGELQYLCKLLPTPMDLIGRRFIPIKNYVKKCNQKFEMHKSGYDKVINVPFLSGCFMFFNNNALKKVKGFDDNFFMYCEDIDLCRRVGMAGYKTVYYPLITVVHAHEKESYKSKAMLKAHVKSALRYFNKWGWFFDKYRIKLNKQTRQQYE